MNKGAHRIYFPLLQKLSWMIGDERAIDNGYEEERPEETTRINFGVGSLESGDVGFAETFQRIRGGCTPI